MADDNKSSGLGFFGLLCIVFIVLKLLGVINWSWWWVLLPAYGGLVLALIICLIGLVFVTIFTKGKK